MFLEDMAISEVMSYMAEAVVINFHTAIRNVSIWYMPTGTAVIYNNS